MIALRPDVATRLDTPDGVRDALQVAIRLEHSTIPPYLYALYSIEPGQNAVAADIIRSVVIEEMGHMALACNILNAIGGSPVIDEPGFIPRYPRPLPGGVDAGLTVGLAPLSVDLVHKVFMCIEEPEDRVPVGDLAAVKEITIGQFYQAISGAIGELGQTIFSPPPRNQVTLQLGDTQIGPVTDVATAQAAITLIVEQGEGTATSPLDLEHDIAHYYRFAEIFHGRKLVRDSSREGYAYTGEPVALDTAKIASMPENPKASDYPAGSRQRLLCDTFNYTYTAVLKALHTTFNGNPAALWPCIGAMESCRQQALDMAFPIAQVPRVPAGPSFEYQPVNPNP